MAGGIVGPDNFPVRDPRDPKQVHGRMVNPPRFNELGGLRGPGKWPKGDSTIGASARTDPSFSGPMKVEKPTRVRGAHATTNRND